MLLLFKWRKTIVSFLHIQLPFLNDVELEQSGKIMGKEILRKFRGNQEKSDKKSGNLFQGHYCKFMFLIYCKFNFAVNSPVFFYHFQSGVAVFINIKYQQLIRYIFQWLHLIFYFYIYYSLQSVINPLKVASTRRR